MHRMGKFWDLCFGISSKEATDPKTWENIVFFLPFPRNLLDSYGKKCQRKAKATLIVSQVWGI